MTRDQIIYQDRRNIGRRRRNNKKNRARHFFKWLALTIAVVILGLAAYSFFWAKSLENKVQFKPKIAKKIDRAVTKPKAAAPINILLSCVDRRANQKYGRADTIALLRIDPKDKSAYLLSIPRDTRVPIKGHGLDKINHSWAFGGAPLLIKTVRNFINLPVNYFFQVDFVSFEKVVNAIGGVDFYLDRGWNDGELGVDVRSGNHHRMGKEALAIVRARHQFAGGDFDRIKNQQRFLTTVMKESLSSYSQVPRLANIMAEDSRTNMDLNTMITLGRSFAGAQDNLQMQTLPGKGKTIHKVWYMIPDQAGKAALLSAMVNKKPFVPAGF